ncbi:methionine adenosyltransferase regulatory beta subunit-related [Hyaloraphidium curvatum]|nr:methionine adenosyltransferase regulatory beta subunit-related [Hyaloraphidium curvatum]
MPLDVLITGGSGYLGQFLLSRLAGPDPPEGRVVGRVAYTYTGNQLPDDALARLAGPISGFPVDFTQPDGGRSALKRALSTAFPAGTARERNRLAVVNCAAISTPAVCESDYGRAAATNVPAGLLDALRDFAEGVEGNFPFVVQLSTDQVFAGDRSWWKETDPVEPVNAYGRIKVEAEKLLREKWPRGRHVSLRSSIIYGPQSPLVPVPRPLFLQFCDKVLGEGKPTTFFEDEFRCPVFVGDVVDIVLSLLHMVAASADGSVPLPLPAYNMGGPERLSRVDMAGIVAEARRYSKEAILAVPSASVQRAVRSPADISMDTSALKRDIGVAPRRMMDVMPEVFLDRS